MLKLRNVSISNFFFRNNHILVKKQLLSSNKISTFFISTNDDDVNKIKNKNGFKSKEENKSTNQTKKIITLKKKENIGSIQAKQYKLDTEIPSEINVKQSELNTHDFKEQILKSKLAVKPPIVMKKQQELKYIYTKSVAPVKELTYKQIIRNQQQEKYNPLLNSSTILKIIREYSSLYINNLEKKYSQILKELIREKYIYLQNEIESMKLIFDSLKQNKNLSEKLDFKNNLQINDSHKNFDKGEFSYIFDLNKNSILDMKAKIKELPKEKYESLKFNIEYSDFYLGVDIDKSFEIFKKHIFHVKISNDLKFLVDKYTGKFLTRIFELDRLIYLPDIISFAENNKLNINLSQKLLKIVETNITNYSNLENFNYRIIVLNLRFLNLLISDLTPQMYLLQICEIFEKLFFQITTYKIKNQIIHKDIEEDELLALTKLLKVVIHNGKNDNFVTCLNKIFALYYEDRNFFSYLQQNLISTKININIIKTLHNNLNAYFNNFGYLPNGFGEKAIINYYFNSIRINMISENTLISLEEIDFLYFLLKCSNLKDLQADFISMLDKRGKIESLKFYYSDFILNNTLEKETLYNDCIEKIYNKKLNVQDKEFADHLLFQTLAYLKDGNFDYAMNNILINIEKRLEFIKNNDNELINIINSLSNSETMNNKESQEFNINLDADFLPFIEQIKTKIHELLSYELNFKTGFNIIIAKENILEKLFDSKKSTDFDEGLSEGENIYYHEKLNQIIFNINQIKNLCNKKELDHFNKLKLNNKKFANEITNPNVHLDEIKIFIYSRFDSNFKIFNDLSRSLKMNFNRIEDFENLNFNSNETKRNLVKNIEYKINELNNYRNINSENKQYLNFYKNFLHYIESKPISSKNEVILSEDMLKYLNNPDFVLKKKIDDKIYFERAGDYFQEYYNKIKKKFPRQNLFVMENVDFLRNNLKITLDNFLINYSNNNLHNENLNFLQDKIEFYEKNLQFVNQILQKTDDFNLKNSTKTRYNINNNDILIKKLILFEADNMANINTQNLNSNMIYENKVNHFIESYLSLFTAEVNRKCLFTYKFSYIGKNKKKIIYPFNNLNTKNLFKFLVTYNNKNSRENNILSSLVEKLILPKINSKKIKLYKNIFAHIHNLEQTIKLKSQERYLAVNDLYCELLKNINIKINKTDINTENLSGNEMNKLTKLKEMKDMIDQNFEVFDLKHCIYMIEFGVEHNIAAAIRIGEKITSLLGLNLPSEIQNKVNKFLITNGEDYAKVAEKISSVDQSKIYKNSKNFLNSESIKTVYDEYLTENSTWANDSLHFKGLEKIYDFKKFRNIIRHFNLKH